MFYLLHGLGLFFIIVLVVYGQEYAILPLSANKCAVSGDNELKYDVGLKDQDESKSFSLSMNLSLTLNESCTYNTVVDMLSGSQYNRYLEADGNVCETLANLMKPAWERFKLELNPSIEESCTIKPGQYSMGGFQVQKDEINVPIPSKGQFRAFMHLFCENSEIACLLTEFQVVEDEE